MRYKTFKLTYSDVTVNCSSAAQLSIHLSSVKFKNKLIRRAVFTRMQDWVFSWHLALKYMRWP